MKNGFNCMKLFDFVKQKDRVGESKRKKGEDISIYSGRGGVPAGAGVWEANKFKYENILFTRH